MQHCLPNRGGRIVVAGASVYQARKARGQVRHSDTNSTVGARLRLSSCPNAGPDPGLSLPDILTPPRPQCDRPGWVDNVALLARSIAARRVQNMAQND